MPEGSDPAGIINLFFSAETLFTVPLIEKSVILS